MRITVLFFFLMNIFLPVVHGQSNTITISSGEWQPYSGVREVTSYEQFIENIFYLAGYNVTWRYPGFDFALKELDRKRTDAAFPFFSTEKRRESYLVSLPIHSTRNILLYNRFSNLQMPIELEIIDHNYRIGSVSGYSYGGFDEVIDRHQRFTFNSELAALEALKDEHIDLLPIEEFVWVALVLQNYPHDYHRFSMLDDIGWVETLHLIMAKTDQNREIISEFNGLLADSLQSQLEGFRSGHQDLFRTINAGTVSLEPTQLQPIIRSTIEGEDSALVVAIQPGTRGVVLRWPDEIFSLPGDLAAIQILRSKVEVLLLSGAHAGSVVTTDLNHIRVGNQ